MNILSKIQILLLKEIITVTITINLINHNINKDNNSSNNNKTIIIKNNN